MQFGAMTLNVERVTPEMAERYLESNDHNRRLRPEVAGQYARDMLNGKWIMKPLAVCFDEQGRLANGQHTLTAITISRLPQTLLIARGVSRDAIGLMDSGLRRTMNDIAVLLGEEHMNGKAAAVARTIAFGPDSRANSFHEVLSAYQTHRMAIDFVLELGATSRIPTSALAVVARASYTCDKVLIARFIEILKTGIAYGDYESAAVRLRDVFASNNLAGRGGRLLSYWKTEAALDAFLRRQPVQRLRAATEELFQIPSYDLELAAAV